MESKFRNSFSFYKAAPILSTVILISTIIGLDAPSVLVKTACVAVSAISFIAFFKCAKHRID